MSLLKNQAEFVRSVTGLASTEPLGAFMRNRLPVQQKIEVKLDGIGGAVDTLWIVQTSDGTWYRFLESQVLRRFGTLGNFNEALKERVVC